MLKTIDVDTNIDIGQNLREENIDQEAEAEAEAEIEEDDTDAKIILYFYTFFFSGLNFFFKI
jgi:hypothetical protein